MVEEGIIAKQDNGLYAITNLGAILLAKRLTDFPRISRKSIRVVQYQGNNRLNMLKEDVVGKGYVVGFEGLIKYIDALLPTQEVIASALREKKTAYPSIAVREAVANALIHRLCKALHNRCYAKLIVMQRKFLFYRKQGLFSFFNLA